MRLTEQQQAVVQHGQGHARVFAVAGAGKTSTMIARVLHLMATGTPADRIMVLMFNRAAREDFAARLRLLAPPGLDRRRCVPFIPLATVWGRA